MSGRCGETISAKGKVRHDPGQYADEMRIELGSGGHPNNSDRDNSACVGATDIGDFYGVEGVGDR